MSVSLPSVKSPAFLTASVREKSTSTLAQALLGTDTEEAKAAIYERASVCIANFFDPDHDPAVKAQVRGSFVKALIDLPLWAILRGFDEWEKTAGHRPAPGNIRILAQRALAPITDELARRRRIEDEQAAERKAAERARMSPDAAARILASAGFTPKRMEAVRKAPMAGSFEEAERYVEQTRVLHWSDREMPDHAALAALEASRSRNSIILEAQAHASNLAAQQASTGLKTASA